MWVYRMRSKTWLYILRGTRNLSFVLRRSLLRTFETIWILVITLECSNITASKSIRRERKMRPMELSGSIFRRMGRNQSVHVLIKSYHPCMMNCKVIILCDLCLQYATAQCRLVTDNVNYRIAHSSVCRRLQINVIFAAQADRPLRFFFQSRQYNSFGFYIAHFKCLA